MTSVMMAFYLPHMAFGLCSVSIALLLVVRTERLMRVIFLAFNTALVSCMTCIAFWSWYLRDGLGPGGRTSVGLEAWAHSFEDTLEVWFFVAIVGILGHLANRRAREYISLRFNTDQFS